MLNTHAHNPDHDHALSGGAMRQPKIRNRSKIMSKSKMKTGHLQAARLQHKYCSRDFPMKRLLSLLILLVLFVVRQAPAAAPANGEYVLLVGGPSLMMWEKYKLQPHDHWWANFIRAARIRTEQIRATAPDAKITWLVYRPGYKDRAAQEKMDLFGFIDSVREKFNLKLVY